MFAQQKALVSLDARESLFFPFLVPLLRPDGRADVQCQLPHILATFLVTLGLLKANEPFVVTVPAVVGLVLGWESGITGSGTDSFYNIKCCLLFFGEFGNFGGENLVQLHDFQFCVIRNPYASVVAMRVLVSLTLKERLCISKYMSVAITSPSGECTVSTSSLKKRNLAWNAEFSKNSTHKSTMWSFDMLMTKPSLSRQCVSSSHEHFKVILDDFNVDSIHIDDSALQTILEREVLG